MTDIRWKQRYQNFTLAFETLLEAKAISESRPLSNLETQGLIQGFEFTHELAWNLLKDYLEHKGFVGIVGSRDASRLAFKNALIADGEVWMDMIRSRNLTSHTYNLSTAKAITEKILDQYVAAFDSLRHSFKLLLQQS